MVCYVIYGILHIYYTIVMLYCIAWYVTVMCIVYDMLRYSIACYDRTGQNRTLHAMLGDVLL